MNHRFVSTDGQPIALSEHQPQVTYRCPHCSEPVLHCRSGKGEVVGQRYWLRDGDTLVYYRHIPEEAQRWVWDSHLLVGGCPHCGNDYYVAELKVMTSAPDFTLKEVWYAFEELEVHPSSATYFASSPDAPAVHWVIEEHKVPEVAGFLEGLAGQTAHMHTFGPFKLEGSLEGPFGVSACSQPDGEEGEWDIGEKLALKVWPAVWELVRRRHAERAEASHSV